MKIIRLMMGCAAFSALCPGEARAAPVADPPKPESHTERIIEGWTVRIDDRLLQKPHEPLGTRVLKSLEARLSDIRTVMQADRLKKMREFVIVLDMSHGKLVSMQYHPSREWLLRNGYSADLARCVHIPVASALLEPRQINVQPWVVLHELAHAYHDQVLGFNEARIIRAHAAFRDSGRGDNALLAHGGRARHYGLTDHKEFFAEMTESYFGTNDFFPFNRGELQDAESDIYQLMVEIWGPLRDKAADPEPQARADNCLSSGASSSASV
jgi:hypothetical protein